MSKRSIVVSGILLVILLLTAMIIVTNEKQDESKSLVLASEYIKAVHYFADEWSANFWNSEWSHIDEDFDQIKKDGFNTIIVVVPWREFQPTISPVSYNEYAISKMELLFQKAQEHTLQVQLRVGYLHDFYSNDDVAQRFYDIVYDNATLTAWIDYVKKVYEVASQYDNFIGGFITWEDFWHNYALVDYVGGTELATLYPTQAAFITYIKHVYDLNAFNKMYQTSFSQYEQIPIPKRDDLYAEVWFAFIDDFTMELLEQSRCVFPELNMEVRTDKDPIGTKKGNNTKFSHEGTWNCRGADYMTIMYQPSQGNRGGIKDISARKAVKNLSNWLKDIYTNNGNIPIYIDQFLYCDNTPTNDEGNIIAENELSEYIELCSTVFVNYTKGYGVWTYKDYCANMLYNSQFSLKDLGWSYNEHVAFQYNDDSERYDCKLSQGGFIKQKVPIERNCFDSIEYIVSFDIKNVMQMGILRITMGNEIKEIEFAELKKIVLHFNKNENFDIKVDILQGECVIDNIKLYSHIQQGHLYDINNQELECIKAIRKLNQDI